MKTVVGLFDTYPHAQTAASSLENAGIPRNDISLVASNETEQYAKNPTSTHGNNDGGDMVGAAVADAGVGAGIGGALGLLAGASLFIIPGLGWLAGAGWLAGMLGGAALGGTIGGIVGALTHIGVPEEDATHYNEGIRRGGVLLAVRADDAQAHRVAEILSDAGAIDIDERATQWKQEGFMATPMTPNTATANTATATTRAAAPMPSAQTAQATTNRAGETVLPVIEESLQVGKREVERGKVRVYSHTTETPVQEQVTLREENVTVQRNPVNRPIGSVDADTFRDQTIEVTTRAEEAVVSKQARVVEEVVVGKQATERTETISDTVRRTDVEVENVPGGTTTGTQRDYSLPGIQTGGRNADGSPDTRGVTEKVADAVTGDRVDDKTGARI